MSFLFDPAEAMKSGVYVSGTTGTGKSDLGMYVADELMKLGITVIVFDPTQDWMKRSTVPHFNNRPHKPETSVVYDISEYTPRQQQELVESFCKHLMREQARTPEQQRRRYFLVFEEAHTYFPEGCMRAKRCQNTIKMMTQGRNFRVRFMCITQFASLIDKNAMRYMRQRYFGATDEPNDTEYVLRFFPKKTREQIAQKIAALEAGQFIYKKSAQWQTIHIEPFKTPHQPQILPQTKQQTTLAPQVTDISKPKRSNGEGVGKAIASVIIALLWFIAILMSLLHRP